MNCSVQFNNLYAGEKLLKVNIENKFFFNYILNMNVIYIL